MNSEAIEIQIWEYIDGSGSAADMVYAEQMIRTDAVWKAKYDELLLLHQQLPQLMETEQPSMRFSKNVMDTISATTIAPATKKYINKHIIQGIAAFFIIIVTGPIVYALATADYSTTSTGFYNLIDTRWIKNVFNSTTFYALGCISIVLALMLLDTILSKRNTTDVGTTHEL